MTNIPFQIKPEIVIAMKWSRLVEVGDRRVLVNLCEAYDLIKKMYIN